MDTLHDRCKRWRVLFNTEKSPKGITIQTIRVFKVGSNVLENVQMYKYLGVVFNSNLNFTCNTDNLGKRAGRALRIIISKVHSLKTLGIKTFEKLLFMRSAHFVLLFWRMGIRWISMFRKCSTSLNKVFTISHLYLT